MKKLMVTYKQFDVVIVPFPFTERTSAKKRPALIISDAIFNQSTQKSVMAMITTASHPPWALDVPLTDLASAGLKAQSIIRMKLFTLDRVLIIKKIGKLTTSDRHNLQQSLQQLFNL